MSPCGNGGVERAQQAGADAAPLGSGIDANVDHARLAAVAVADGAADDAAILARDQKADVGQDSRGEAAWRSHRPGAV